MKYLRKAQFAQSAATLVQCPTDSGFEVAFVGRSNSGKSSVINRITDNSKLARTSKTPGRTQLLNFFDLDEQRRLVDLPGYGFAKVHSKVQKAWEKEMTQYLQHRGSLRGLILVMDIRHPLQAMDQNFLNWASASGVPVHLLLNKSDKMSKNLASNQFFKVKKLLEAQGLTEQQIQVQLFSALRGTGSSELIERIAQWLEL